MGSLSEAFGYCGGVSVLGHPWILGASDIRLIGEGTIGMKILTPEGEVKEFTRPAEIRKYCTN